MHIPPPCRSSGAPGCFVPAHASWVRRAALRFAASGMLATIALGGAPARADGAFHVTLGAVPSAVDPTLWYITRAAGATAYALLVAVTALGISLGFRGFEGIVRGWRIYDLHQVLTLVMLGFTSLHLATLFLDPFKPFTILQLVWPLAETYRPLRTALGVLALYLLLLVTASTYLRRALGNRMWFLLHLLSYAAFILTTLHGIFGGTDTTTPWMLGVYTGSSALVLLLTLGRIYLALSAGRKRSQAARQAAEPAGARR
jgi:sulfoxide reductase heme-binding subunit YedZ